VRPRRGLAQALGQGAVRGRSKQGRQDDPFRTLSTQLRPTGGVARALGMNAVADRGAQRG
jgi:hypothetical protein